MDYRILLASLLLSTGLACGETSPAADDFPIDDMDGEDGTDDEGGTDGDTGHEQEPPPRPSFGVWEKIDLDGAVCGNGTPYKIFANYHEGAKDVMVILEPGGACWDYASCTGAAGILGAANPNGISDTHLSGLLRVLTPLIVRESESNPIHDWNYVFVPYCTGDIHTGNAVTEYTDDASGMSIEYHHAGHANVLATIDWMRENFPSIPRLLVTGSSAGGAGALANYFFFRTGLDVDRGYLLNDSGPIFPNSTASAPLHQTIRENWNLDSVLEVLPEFAEIGDDFGNINTTLADEFPADRLAITFFRRDFNYSRYSYERFYEDLGKEDILDLWWEDTQKLVEQFDGRDNLAYYIPYWRSLNDSHCTLLLNWDGTEIQEQGVDVGDFIDVLLDDDVPLQSYLEAEQPDEDI